MGQCACNSLGVKNGNSGIVTNTKNQNKKIKILLLGTGNSGKSTIFKQFQLEYKNGFSSTEKEFYRDLISRSTISTTKALLQNANDLLFECGLPKDSNKIEVSLPYPCDIKLLIVTFEAGKEQWKKR